MNKQIGSIEEIAAWQDELTAIRRDIHAHPELGFEETRTSDLVAEKLAGYGCEVHRGLGKTGVVGTLRVGNSTRSVGLRADMDALPMQEVNTFEHRSTHDGKMHACGHDGHTTMLLGAARYLAETMEFDGQVHFIFQPAEEGIGGARAMIEDGLFEQFPCDVIFGMHNRKNLEVGKFAVRPGPMMAAKAGLCRSFLICPIRIQPWTHCPCPEVASSWPLMTARTIGKFFSLPFPAIPASIGFASIPLKTARIRNSPTPI